LEEWKEQVAIRQARIQAAVTILYEETPTELDATEVMCSVFPARLDRFCFQNQYKRKCQYCDLCYHKIDDPLESGVYMVREPHHPTEFEEE